MNLRDDEVIVLTVDRTGEVRNVLTESGRIEMTFTLCRGKAGLRAIVEGTRGYGTVTFSEIIPSGLFQDAYRWVTTLSHRFAVAMGLSESTSVATVLNRDFGGTIRKAAGLDRVAAKPADPPKGTVIVNTGQQFAPRS